MQGTHGDPEPPTGVVELREDVPLKAGADGADAGWWGGAGCGWCAGGPRLIIACFAALTVSVTLALFTQIYYGDYEVVPHGSVSSSFAACSRAGTDALKAGGRALDAAAAAALCLAVAHPHRTSLDASGAMIYWEYRQLRTQKPVLVEWGGAPVQAGTGTGAAATDRPRPPRLVVALAALHMDYGALPWPRLLQPAIDLARNGFRVSETLALALAAETTGTATAPPVDTLSTAPQLAAYLESLQLNTSAELSTAWAGTSTVRKSSPLVAAAGAARVYAGGAGTAPALHALTLALDPPPADLDDASRRVVAALQLAVASETPNAEGYGESVSTGLAVVDRFDTYIALVTGLSTPFGSGPATPAGWTRDEPKQALDLAPAVMVDTHVCGTRYVMGAESSAALVQVAAALGAGGGAAAVERSRVVLRPGGALAAEALRPTAAPAPAPAYAITPALNATPPYAAVNLVQQSADALLSHADSRGGGLASRF